MLLPCKPVIAILPFVICLVASSGSFGQSVSMRAAHNPKTVGQWLNYLAKKHDNQITPTTVAAALVVKVPVGSQVPALRCSIAPTSQPAAAIALQSCQQICATDKVCMAYCPEGRQAFFAALTASLSPQTRQATITCRQRAGHNKSVLAKRGPSIGRLKTSFVATLQLQPPPATAATTSTPQMVAMTLATKQLPRAQVSTPIGPVVRFQRQKLSNVSFPLERQSTSQPEIPYSKKLLALPLGAKIQDITITGTNPKTQTGITLYPNQAEQRDRPGYPRVPWQFDRHAYEKHRTKISDYQISPVRHAGKNLVWLRFPLVDYNPKKRTLTTYDDVAASIVFAKPGKCYHEVPAPRKNRRHNQQQALAGRAPLERLIANQDALISYGCRNGQPLQPQSGDVADEPATGTTTEEPPPPRPRPLPPRPPLRPRPSPGSPDLVRPITPAPRPGVAVIRPSRPRLPGGNTVRTFAGRSDGTFAASPADGSFEANQQEPLLLIVYHPDFAAAAARLASHKRDLGLNPHLVDFSDIAANGDPEKDPDDHLAAYIAAFYEAAQTKPRWLLLLGDSAFIPTHYARSLINRDDRAYNAGDTWYGQIGQGRDAVPLVAVGRLPVTTADEAEAQVSKIINYETQPSRNPAFAKTIVSATTFFDLNGDNQSDQRLYAEVVEDGYQELIHAAGYELKRVYQATAGSLPALWSDGRALAPELIPQALWQNTGSDLLGQLSTGALLGFHRGHALWDRWGQPDLTTDLLATPLAFSGQSQPLLIGVNCLSGMFDTETVWWQENASRKQFHVYDHQPDPEHASLGEHLIRGQQGAIGFIGATRSSRTLFNDVIGYGFLAAVFTADPQLDRLRLGDILTYGKAYLAGIHADPAGHSRGLKEQLLIYNLLGDPSLELNHLPPLALATKVAVATTTLGRAVTVASQLTAPDCSSCTLEPTTGAQEILNRQVMVVIKDADDQVLFRELLPSDGRLQVLLPATSRGLTVVVSGRSVGASRWQDAE